MFKMPKLSPSVRPTLIRSFKRYALTVSVAVAVAFALAFLFRTFEAEAFVIPTGSMAPTLQGRHQDVDCPMCGFPYRVSASQEIDPANEQKQADVIGGECLNCRYWACTNRSQGKLLGYPRPFNVGALELDAESKSANGDRIIVSKFAYAFQDPARWDVFVFRFPGNASRNYIKRLVGLPGETLKLHRGDVFRSETIAENETEARSLDYINEHRHKASGKVIRKPNQ